MTFTAGAATADITPADLTALNPIGGTSFVGVHDPIRVRALVLHDGASEVALLSAELIECGDMRALRARIEAELGIPADHVMITATHTHNAPRLGAVSPGALAHNGGPESAAYTSWVYDRILAALRSARSAARPARFGIGAGHAAININREVYAEGTAACRPRRSGRSPMRRSMRRGWCWAPRCCGSRVVSKTSVRTYA